jgi:hypothetical protein
MSRFFGNTAPLVLKTILRRNLLPEEEPAPDRYEYSASPAVAARMAHHPLSKLGAGQRPGIVPPEVLRL